MPKKILYIHAGIDKSGSSVLQRMLCASSEGLAKAGYRYLNSGRGEINHRPLFAQAKQKESDLWRQAAAELTDSGLNGIISFESFFRLKEDMLQPVREIYSGCECCVVIYLRRQSEYICSGLAQRMERRTPFYPLVLEEGKFTRTNVLETVFEVACP